MAGGLIVGLSIKSYHDMLLVQGEIGITILGSPRTENLHFHSWEPHQLMELQAIVGGPCAIYG